VIEESGIAIHTSFPCSPDCQGLLLNAVAFAIGEVCRGATNHERADDLEIIQVEVPIGRLAVDFVRLMQCGVVAVKMAAQAEAADAVVVRVGAEGVTERLELIGEMRVEQFTGLGAVIVRLELGGEDVRAFTRLDIVQIQD